MAKRSKKVEAPQINVGDFVLMGGTRASYPGEWYFGEVLWTGKGDVLLNRSTMNGESYRQLCTVSEVRAKGTIDQLVAVREEARKAVATLTDAIRDCENRLGAARTDMWAALDALAARGLQVIPPDFERMEADRLVEQAVVEAVDAEAMAMEPA